MEPVDILQTNRQTGLADVVAQGVRMYIVPLERIPQESVQAGRSPARKRFGAVVETPNAELVRLRQVRRTDGTVLNILNVLDNGFSDPNLANQELELEQVSP